MTPPAVIPDAINGTSWRSRRRPGRILLVDDRPDKLLTLGAALAPLGCEIVKAGSGREALRWLLRHDFDAILLDMNMPGMDGFETSRLIRQRRRNEHTPIIFITAYGDEIQVVQGYSLGAVDFILTPIVPELLRSKVNVFLELHERTAEAKEQAGRLLRRTRQLQQLARAALEIHASYSIKQTLQTATDSAQEIIGVRQACTILTGDQIGLPEPWLVFSPAQLASAAVQRAPNVDLRQAVRELSESARFTATELAATALGRLFPRGSAVAPASGLCAALIGRDGNIMGVLLAADRRDEVFNDDDEALLMQLAQMTATAIENTLFADARESNRIKDEFLATLSHELRTPLSSILGWSQLLRTHMLDPEETAEALEIIEQNARMQCKLVEDLLDVSRIVSGKLQLTIRPISLAAVIHAAVNVVVPAAKAKQLQIDVVLDEGADSCNGDPDRLQQVLWNLLSNAVKFTPPGGRIELRLEAVDAHARISVRDNGEGIAPEFLPHVFDRFRQADSSTSRRYSGLGIGLAIAQHVVQLHGGSVHVDSAGKGLGTTFAVNLPLAQSVPPTQGLQRCCEMGQDAELQETTTMSEPDAVRLS